MINYNNIKNKKVCILLSGGVDSAVSLYELVSHGINPDCWYIKIGPEEEDGYNCNSDEDIEMCEWLANHFNCKLSIINLHKEYWDNVTSYTMDKVKNGLTPNPDVMCNTLIKFGAFYNKIGKDYDYIATGHYAQTYTDNNGTVYMQTTPDPVKDQTDFLCNIDPILLPHIIFPIGHMKKDDVRKIAERENLINKKRKDSQGICFLGKINYNSYIEKFLGKKSGNILEYGTNNVLGRHDGHWFHTIGQRKGLKLSGGPWYVVKKDIEQNIIYVSKDQNILNQSVNKIKLNDIHWLAKDGMKKCKCILYPPLIGAITFKFRHSPEYYHGKIIFDIDGTTYITTEETITGVAPGQFCVIYDNDFNLVLGSAEITL